MPYLAVGPMIWLPSASSCLRQDLRRYPDGCRGKSPAYRVPPFTVAPVFVTDTNRPPAPRIWGSLETGQRRFISWSTLDAARSRARAGAAVGLLTQAVTAASSQTIRTSATATEWPGWWQR